MQKLLLAGESGLQRVRQALSQGGCRDSAGRACSCLRRYRAPARSSASGGTTGAHAKESGSGPFEQPRIFTKVASSAAASRAAAIRIPDPILKPDFEVELAVVIGASPAMSPSRMRSAASPVTPCCTT